MIPRCLLFALLALAACRPALPHGLRFVRGGVLLPTVPEAAPTGRFVAVDWVPGAHVAVAGLADEAPVRPECAPLFSVPLGDLDALVSRGISTPGTALAWGPGGLVVGSYLGEVLVLDGWTGAVRARRRLAESAIKRVAWSADGRTVYAAEQSPDALVVALDAADLRERWRFRLADELEPSAPPVDDIYGMFTLPAAYGLDVLPDGDLLVVGLHTWPVEDGRRNRSRVWRLSPEGQVRAAFPADGTADAVFRAPHVRDGLVAFPVGRSASGPAPRGLPIDGVLVLGLDDLRPRFAYVGEPLRPHFQQAGIWEAVDLRADRVLVGFADGRLQLAPLDGGPVTTLELGTPIVAGDVPVAASVSWGRFTSSGGLVAATGPSNIPWGSEVAASRPPAAHPGGNTVWAYDADGTLAWNWHADLAVQGLSLSPDGRRLAVGGGPRSSDDRRDRFGAAVFRMDAAGSGEERLEVFCPTAAPVFFDHALADDGRLAVSEVPFLPDAGAAVVGSYRVTVLR